MPDSPNTVPKSGLGRLGRTLARSPVGLAWIAWYARDFVAKVVPVCIAVQGAELAGRWLPIPATTRARWNEENRLAKDHPAFFWQKLLWVGPCLVFFSYWKDDFGKWPKWHDYDYIGPLLFTLIGLICVVICHRYARRIQRGKTSDHEAPAEG
jgi:hypothetical protein